MLYIIKVKLIRNGLKMKLSDILNEMTVDNALKLFKLSHDDLNNKSLIKNTYRQLSKKYHPDKGGNVDMMKKIMIPCLTIAVSAYLLTGFVC